MFAPSFELSEEAEYLAFFEKYGYVVIDNVLNDKECQISCDEIWDYIEFRAPNVVRTDDRTWTEKNWPKDICRNGGFMGKFPYWKRATSLNDTFLNQQPQSWRNRENPKVYQAFTNILNTSRLWVSIDRYGIMRPTLKTNEENWQTKEEWLHWDLSPFHFGTSAAGFGPNPQTVKKELKKEYGSLRVQGLITLKDCPKENGGFHCVPGFVNDRFFEWAQANKDDYGALPEIAKRNFIEVPTKDPIRSEISQIPMRAGSLLIWNSQLPHGNFPNQSEEFRMVQYIKMIPVDDPREFVPAIPSTNFQLSEWFPSSYQPSKLGKQLLGLENY